MNIYENIVILNTSLADEEVEAAITKIKDFITDSGGEILRVDIWGKKKLAYEIKKQRKGLYVLLLLKTVPSTIKKLEEFYKVFEAVIKYITIKFNTKQIQNFEKTETLSEPVEQKMRHENV